MGKQGSLYRMLCEICISDHSANTYNLEETTKLFNILWTCRQQEYLSVSELFIDNIKIPQHILTQSSIQTLERDIPFCPALFLVWKNKLESKNWLLKKKGLVPTSLKFFQWQKYHEKASLHPWPNSSAS